MKKTVLLFISFCMLGALAGCGGSTPPPPMATQFSVTSAVNTITAGTALNFTVTALDATNAVVSSYAGTVHFTSTDPQAALPASSALTNGTGSFSVTLKTASRETITATDANALTGTSSSIIVNAAAASKFSVSAPATATARTPFTLTVTAIDPYSNTATGYNGTVHFTSSDPKAVLPANSTLPNGAGSFTAIAETAGSQSFTATDAMTASLTGNSGSVATTAPATLMITSNAPPNGTVDAIYGGTRTEYELCGAGGCYACTPTPFPGTCGTWPPCGYSKPCIARLDFSGFKLNATGGVPPYSWNASSLPPGLGVTVENKEVDLSGTPPAGSNATYTGVQVVVHDSGNPQAQIPASYTIVINNPPPPVIRTTPSPSAGALNLPYSFTFAADGGQRPLTWSATGALPLGVNPLTASGVLSGTPATTGAFPLKVTAQDSLGQNSALQNFTISIYLHGFKATGSMGVERSGQTANLLGNGKVLVAGGAGSLGVPTTAEIFDPATGTFVNTGSMGAARVFYTATSLGNGKVFVAGGYDGNNALPTAELFDSTAGTFAPTTGSLLTARYAHTAVLLNNNKVLLMGGWDNSGDSLTSAELFDPATGNFAPTGSMGTSRSGYTANLLGNGKVLLAGGFDTGGLPLATAELYDPVTGTFAPTASMATARTQHTATLLNTGRVLLAGGLDATGTPVAIAEFYDPAAGTFAAAGALVTPRAHHTATLLNDNTVLLTGGQAPVSIFSSAELFDPVSGTFAATGSMESARIEHTATLLNDGKVLVTGGRDVDVGGTILATAELYK
jgi:hypothetical protein